MNGRESCNWSCKCRTFKVSSSVLTGQPRKTWNEVIRSNLKETKVSKVIPQKRNAWKSIIRNCPIPASIENRHKNKYDD